MAGADPNGNFVAADFRSRIQAAMQMGLPNASGDAPTFRWVEDSTYAHADPAGQPYDWTATPTSTPTPIADLAVDCAVQFSGEISVTEAGEIVQGSAVITLLDVDQQTLVSHGGRMPDQVLLKGIVYNVDFIPPPQGLFDVDVWTIYCSSIDSEGGN